MTTQVKRESTSDNMNIKQEPQEGAFDPVAEETTPTQSIKMEIKDGPAVEPAAEGTTLTQPIEMTIKDEPAVDQVARGTTPIQSIKMEVEDGPAVDQVARGTKTPQSIKMEVEDGPAVEPSARGTPLTQPIKMEVTYGNHTARYLTLDFGAIRAMKQEYSNGGIEMNTSINQEPIDTQPEEQEMPSVLTQDEQQERSNSGIDKGTQTEEQEMPFALTQDEIWELAQKLNTFTPFELQTIIFIAEAHGQVLTQGQVKLKVFELEGDCLREVYGYIERTWMEKLRNANLLPPLPSSDANDEGVSQQQQDIHVENADPGPSNPF